MSLVEFATEGEIAIVTINRPEARNAVDRPTAAALAENFRRFDADDALSGSLFVNPNYGYAGFAGPLSRKTRWCARFSPRFGLATHVWRRKLACAEVR